ncbi:hypothetical protein ACFLS9_03710 [Bacteroidota bacterium]
MELFTVVIISLGIFIIVFSTFAFVVYITYRINKVQKRYNQNNPFNNGIRNKSLSLVNVQAYNLKQDSDYQSNIYTKDPNYLDYYKPGEIYYLQRKLPYKVLNKV